MYLYLSSSRFPLFPSPRVTFEPLESTEDKRDLRILISFLVSSFLPMLPPSRPPRPEERSPPPRASGVVVAPEPMSPKCARLPSSESGYARREQKRSEKDNEWHLMSQIKALNKQLEEERVRRKEEKRKQEAKARLIVVANRLPVTPHRDERGEWVFRRSSGGTLRHPTPPHPTLTPP